MKKLFLLLGLLLLSVAVFCQVADESLKDALIAIGITPGWAVVIGSLLVVIGKIIPNKWMDIFVYVEKIFYAIYLALSKINDKTNNLSKKQRCKKVELKKTALTACLLFFILGGLSAQDHPLRWYPFITREYVSVYPDDLTISEATVDSTIYFGPSVAFNVFQRESKTGDYTLGVIPGVGYGIKWNPFEWKDGFLLGLDLFVQADVNESGDKKYFTIDFLPVITVLNWVHIGYGPRWNIGLDGTKNANTGVFLIGITKSL